MLDGDIVEHFKRRAARPHAAPYQTQINQALRQVIGKPGSQNEADAGIEEIYTLAAAALRAGQGAFDVHVFPFRLTDSALAACAGSQWFDFWSTLKPGYDDFERTHVPPRVKVENARYRIEV